MIKSDAELRAARERIERLQRQIEHLRQAESNPENYRQSAAGFLAELDRMNLEVREYLSLHPTDLAAAVQAPSEPAHPAAPESRMRRGWGGLGVASQRSGAFDGRGRRRGSCGQ